MNDLTADTTATEATNAPLADDVIVTVGSYPAGAQICVRHRPYGVDVDYREQPDHAWSPVQFWGGSVEIRPQSVELLPCQEDVGRTDETRNNAPVLVLVDTAGRTGDVA